MGKFTIANSINLIEKNREGYLVIHGIIGTKRYLYYPKKEAIKMYMEEVRLSAITEE